MEEVIIKPNSGILLVKKHGKTKLKSDIVVQESDYDKTLVSCEVLSENNNDYPVGTTIIIGKYSLFELVFKGEHYWFCDNEDVIGIIQGYKE